MQVSSINYGYVLEKNKINAYSNLYKIYTMSLIIRPFWEFFCPFL